MMKTIYTFFLCTQELSRPASICSACLAQTYKEEENIPSSMHSGLYKAMNTPGEQVHGGVHGVGQDTGVLFWTGVK